MVINDPDDQDSVQVCKDLDCRYEIFTDCNDSEGRIEDFSLARNKSISMATSDYCGWIDSDDLMISPHKLNNLISCIPPTNVCVMLPYEYSYTETGAVSCRHYRERIFPNNGSYHFVGAVHEVLIPIPGKDCQQPIKTDDITIKHQRQFISKPVESGRNLRILEKSIVSNPDDPRLMYYIGLEYYNNGIKDKAIQYLSKYVEVSGWDDERVMACFKLIEAHGEDLRRARDWAFKALSIHPGWFECYYHLCRLFYFQQDWQAAVDFGRLALSKPPTDTLLFINENDRHEIHLYLNVALNNIGAIEEAYQSCISGLQGMPGNAYLTNNKENYENHFAPPKPVELKPTDPDCLDIIFVAGAGLEKWSPITIEETGAGGSETMMYQQAKNLAALGHKVRVFAMVEGEFGGVEYLHHSKFRNVACDVLVASRDASFLDDRHNCKAHLRLIWAHDIGIGNALNKYLVKTDRVLALSKWHKETLMQIHNLHSSKMIQTRNGVDLSAFKRKIKRHPFKLINSSSPDRSWPVLLDCFDEIKKQVPKAELHLFYGFHNWRMMAANDSAQLDLINSLEKRVKTTPGVFYHGRVSPKELTKAFLSSKVWAHSCWFQETSCITAMQALASNCRIVTSALAALNETAAPGTLIEGDWTSESYKAQFVAACVEAIHAPVPDYREEAKQFDLVSLAKDWEQMFLQLLQEKKEHPITAYQPSRHYLGAA